jgi:hypothetical protein
MTETTASNALKHGAFSEVLILPGEDPAAFEELKRRLFAEYNVSGCSEEKTMTSIAKAMWQLQRLGLYEYVQHLRARGSGQQSFSNWKNPISEAINDLMGKTGRRVPDNSLPEAPTVPVQPAEKTNDEHLLELGDLVTLDHLDKELDVESKLLVKLDRLFKRFFQIRAMKPLIGLAESSAPALAGTTPVLELTATDASSAQDSLGHATEFEGNTADPEKSAVV